MQVDYKIKADGADVTALFKDRLIALSIVDEAGIKSDTAEIIIDDRDYRVALPKTGALLEISMGFKETGLVLLGLYTVDEITGTGPALTMTIKAKAANLLEGLRAPKTRAWEDVTLKDIVSAIAGENGLKAAVSDSLADHAYAYLAQSAESDLNLLTRLARDLDATTKPVGDALVFVTRGSGETPDGSAIPVTQFNARDLARWTWSATTRGTYKTATAEWTNIDAGTLEQATIGEGDPTLKLRHPFATEAEATRAATSALSRIARASGKLNVELGGFHGALFAQAPVHISGIKPELSGRWSITRVEHRLQQTLTTKFTAERDYEKETT